MRKQGTVVLTLALIFSLLFTISLTSDGVASEPLPEINLTVPDNEGFINYLGLKGKKPGDSFQLAEVDTDILVIELFSMYCPFCQEEAPRVNNFYELISNSEKINSPSIKIVGLGASNSQFEVEYFRDSFEVLFPLFPDKDLSLYKKLGGEGTPGFLGAIFKKGQKPQIILRESGGFENADSFLALLLQKAGY